MTSDVLILTRSQKFFYFVAKVTGLAPFTIKDNKLYPATCLSKAYNVILTAIVVLFTLMQLYYKSNCNAQFTTTQYFVWSTGTLLRCASSVSCLLILSFRSEVLIEMIKRIHVIGDQLRRLKNAKKDDQIFKSCTVKVFTTNIIVIAVKLFVDSSVSLDRGSLGFTMIENFELLMLYFQSFNASLIFVQIIHCINQGFKHLNNELQDFFRSDCETLACDESQSVPSATRAGNNRIVADHASPGRTIRYSAKHIAKIRGLHKELCDILECTTEFFSILLIWILGYQFYRLLFTSFALFSYAFSSVDVIMNTGSSDLTVLHLIGRLTITLLEIYYVVDPCTTTYKVGNRMKIILHQVWNKFRPVKLRDEFLMFSIQLLRNLPVVSVLGIVDLDYSYPYKMACANLAYLIIMIQLKKF